MNIDNLNLDEKKVYWKAFYEQKNKIDEFRNQMMIFNPEWATIDSRGLIDAVNQIFANNFEDDVAIKAVEEYRSEKIALDLQIAFDLQCQFEDEYF